MIAGGNWWRANEIVMRHLTRQTDARYRSRDKTRKLIQHGLDGRIGDMTEVGVDRFAREKGHGFAVRTDCAVIAWPSIGDFRAGKHAGKGGVAGLDTALHPGASSAHSLGNVEHSALGVPALAQADADAKVASRALRAGHDDIVFGPRLGRPGDRDFGHHQAHF
jgi:hypothetical protein